MTDTEEDRPIVDVMPRTNCQYCGRVILGGYAVWWYGDSPYCSKECRGDEYE